ncbi:MAG: hypothetical protein AB1505_05715 [Candidatus Latescibacterota bacterium]
MKWRDLLEAVDGEPVFSSGLLLVGEADKDRVHQQLTVWTQNRRLLQLRRGL